MCGIVGLAGDIFKKEKDAFEQMLIFSQVRGPHSTGVGSVGKNKNEVIVAKCIGRPDNLIDYDKRYDKVVDFGKKFMLGHNRWATTGLVNKRNAHPFLMSNIMGCHNGTVSSHHLKNLTVDWNAYGTDSEAILANMNDHSIKDTFARLVGAWAFVWFDSRDNTVNMLRNSARDLYYVYSEDRKTLFWASEGDFLRSALGRNEVKREKVVYQLPPDKHLKWKIPEFNKVFETPTQTDVVSGSESWDFRKNSHGFFPVDENFGEADSEQAASFPSQNRNTVSRSIVSPNSLPQNNSSGQDTLKDNTGALIDKETGAKVIHLPAFLDRSKTPPEPVNKPISEIAKDFRHASDLRNFDGQGYFKKKHTGKNEVKLYRGYRGAMMNKDAFEQATKEGCAWCDQTAIWGQPIRFIEDKRHICLECNNDPFVVEAVGKGAM